MTNLRILYLEDNEADRRAFFCAVRDKGLGYEVTPAETLEKARFLLAEFQFDLTIANYNLPDGHSTELLRELGEMPFILLTGTLEEQVALRTLEHGADDYLPKDAERRYLDALSFTIQKTLHQKRLTQELRQSEERLAAFMRNLPGAAWIKDLDGRYVSINSEAERVFGVSSEFLRGKRDEDIFPPETARQFQENDRRALAENGSLQTTEVLRQSDGVDHHSVVRKFALKDISGRPAYVAGVAFDITEHIRAEEALRESEARFRSTFENAAVGVSQISLEGCYLLVNQCFCDIVGYTKEELLGRHFSEITHPEDNDLDKSDHLLLTSGRIDSYKMEKRYIRKDGTEIWTLVTRSLQRDESGKPLYSISIVQDITSRKQAEEQLRQVAQFPEENPNPVLRLSDERRLLYSNRAGMDLLTGMGWHADQPIPLLLGSLIDPKSGCNFEREIMDTNGRVFSFTVTRIRKARYVNLYGRDVTAQKRAQEALQESEVRFRNLADALPVLIWQCKPDLSCDYFNKSWLEFTGRTTEKQLCHGWAENLHPDDRQRCLAKFRSSASRREPFEMEYRLRHNSGEYRWVLDRGVPRFTANGTFMGYLGGCTDISDRKRFEEVLRRSEDRYRGIVQASAAAVWSAHPDARVIEDSPSWRAFTGQTLEQFLDWGWLDAVHSDDRAQAEMAWRNAVEREKTYQTEYRLWHAPTGRYRNTLAKGVRVLNEDGSTREWVGMNIDVTELRETEAARRESEELLRLALSAAEMGSWDYDPSTGKISYDERTQAILGGARPQLYSEVFGGIIHEQDMAQVDAAVQHALRPESDGVFSAEFRVLWPDGSLHWIRADGKTIFVGKESDRRAVRMAGTVEDVTDKKMAETALREAMERYERQVRLFEGVASTTPDFVYIFDRQGRFVYANSRLLEVWGMKLPEIIGKTPRDLGYEQWHHEMHMQEIAEVIKTRRPIKGEVPFKAPRTGIFGVYEYIFTPVIGPDGEVELIAGTTRDVTERKQAEEAVEDARKSAENAKTAAEQANRAKDHFLAVLSHELRTPLTPVVMGVSMLQDKTDLSQNVQETLKMIRQNVEMEARLIDDLLDVTRIARGKIELDRRKVEIDNIIQGAVEVCRADIDARKLHFGVDMGPVAPYWVNADPSRLQQVFWNLLKNAIKFTPNGGCVGIQCRPNRTHVLIEVNDSGIGIEPEALSRVFDAFEQAERSITRQFGGLGLGLAISKALVEMHGGTIEAHSQGLNRGATFRVRLPLSTPIAKSEEPDRRSPSDSVPPLRILLVEDHGVTAHMIKMVLSEKGHDVEVAGDKATALELADRHSFDLLVSDLGLPDGSGHDLIKELRMRGKEFPGIALSGYGQEQDISSSHKAGFAAHLTKPASREAIFAAVAAAVRGNGHPTPDFFITHHSPADVPIFDADAALKRCFGKRETLEEMVEFFPKESSELLSQMHSALDKADVAEIRHATHRLKGSLFYLGAQLAVEAVARVEEAAKSGHLEAAEEAVSELEQQVEVLKKTLACHARNPGSGNREG